MRTNLLLPKDLVEEVDRYAGPRGRSHYVAEALKAKLSRDRLRQAVRATAGSITAEEYPHWAPPDEVRTGLRPEPAVGAGRLPVTAERWVSATR
ncbi:MAG TPA: hypothetical protein VFH63_10505 [candidate division Zixibacteria bacterium]|nr:hypothetical protein [candidate division Zixibacteria bacterium]